MRPSTLTIPGDVPFLPQLLLRHNYRTSPHPEAAVRYHSMLSCHAAAVVGKNLLLDDHLCHSLDIACGVSATTRLGRISSCPPARPTLELRGCCPGAVLPLAGFLSCLNPATPSRDLCSRRRISCSTHPTPPGCGSASAELAYGRIPRCIRFSHYRW